MTCVWASKDSDQLYTHWVAKDPVFLHAVKTLIDWADVQADLSLHWAHIILLLLSCFGSYLFATTELLE